MEPAWNEPTIQADLSPTDICQQRRQNLIRLAFTLLFVSPGIAFFLYATGHSPSTLFNLKVWVLALGDKATLEDSWKWMRIALNWFNAHPNGRIYEQLYFTDHMRFQYPPSSLLLHMVFERNAIELTNVILTQVNWWLACANISTVGALAFHLARRSDHYTAYRWPLALLGAFAAMFFYPTLDGFHLGQIQVWDNLLFALAALAWIAGFKRTAGALLGAICLIKPQFVCFLLWALFRREWRFAIGLAVIQAAGLCAALAIFGLQNHLDYIAELMELGRIGEVCIINQSVNGFLNRFFQTGDPYVWVDGVFPKFHPLVYSGVLVTSTAMIAAALLLPRGKTRDANSLDFSTAALTFTIASPIAWTHHYGILPAIFVIVFFSMLTTARAPITFWHWGALSSSYFLTAHWFGGSSMFVGGLLLLGLLYWLRLFVVNEANEQASVDWVKAWKSRGHLRDLSPSPKTN